MGKKPTIPSKSKEKMKVFEPVALEIRGWNLSHIEIIFN